jgi:para-aminobenzoate synthetase component I
VRTIDRDAGTDGVRYAATGPRTDVGAVDLDALAVALAPCDLLETAGPERGWSYLVPHDGPVLVDDGHRTVLEHPDGTREPRGHDPFAAIEVWCDELGITPDTGGEPAAGDPAAAGGGPAGDHDEEPGFTGGLVGALAYDLARRIERVPEVARDDREQDHLHLRLADLVVAVCPDRRRVSVVGRDLSGRGDLEGRARRLLSRVEGAPTVGPPSLSRHGQQVRTSLSRADYLDAVERILEHIAAGSAFQVNLAQRLTGRFDGDALTLYRGLRAHSPAPFGACLPSIGLASVSPETFLAADGRRVRTRPVKGTRPRAADPVLDAAHADDLVTSSKDRAENVMVVDLERNDLGRVCEPGSVVVPELCRLEAHPTVWHLVSDVEGRLREGVGWGELLRATFPCGSITGAPKVAAMTIIEQLEQVRRGWYCGAVGYLAPGRLRLSVAIRTATRFPDGTVDHGAGGGIVAESDPVAEHAESLDKGAAFLRTLAATSVVPA